MDDCCFITVLISLTLRQDITDKCR